ncbi:hypothetical protein V7S43_000077 [Phytophthora oleae]|uniref:Cyclic nucleotide-binding domain-containing protein n=1 Tax=Phytophthora oleae TaxID=2107226 RepID=A0ABD3G6C9_9STRA
MMERPNTSLAQVAEQRYGSRSSFKSPVHNSISISLEQYNRLEKRLDQLQEENQTTHRMLRDLSELVHQQVRLTTEKNQQRRRSDTTLPLNYRLFTENPPLVNLTGLDLVRPITPENEKATAIDDKASDTGPPITEPTFPPKKLSLPFAVPDATISAQWLSPVDTNELDEPKENTRTASKFWLPQLPNRGKKITPATDEPKSAKSISDDDEITTRRFSVSSIDLVKSQSAAMMQKVDGERKSSFGVSPEDIKSARKIEGELSRFTLRHDSPYRTAWDLMVILMILLDLVFTPLSLGFNYKSAFLSTYSTVESVMFVIDFLVRMFSSYLDEHGNLISGPQRTVTNYFSSGWAIPDLLSWFPFEIFGNAGHNDVVGFLKIFRLAKVSHLAYRLNSAKKAGLVRFVMLLGLVFVISHLLACYWSWVAEGWRAHLDEGSFVPRSLFEEYSLCWSLVIGCVNASPPVMYTAVELISVACFMLIGNILQASVFGAVAALIASFDENEAAYSKKIITTLERCRFLGIPEELSRRIRGYYENLWRETKSVSADADSFINELSPALICEVKFQLYRDMLKQIPFLSSKTLAPAVIEVLVLHLRTVIYMQDDVLIRKGEFGDWMGFIGSKGSVGVLDPNLDMIKIIRILRKGDYFGEMALLQNTKRSATTVALTWVQIHVLCRQDLDYVKELYPTQADVLESEITKYKHLHAGIEKSLSLESLM